MKLKVISAPSMKELFITEIENLILSGELCHGDKLPTEREMAEQMKVSRTITNAGLKELERKGFINIIPRKGAFVADYKRKGTAETLMAIIRFHGGRFDRDTFHSLMDLRILLETESAFLAAKNRTDEDLARLEMLLEQLENCEGAASIAELKFEFSHSLICASGNVVYPLLLTTFKDPFVIFTNTVYRKGNTQDATLYLRELLEAIKNRDSEGAKRTMQNLLDERIRVMEGMYYD